MTFLLKLTQDPIKEMRVVVCSLLNVTNFRFCCFFPGQRLCEEPAPVENGHIMGSEFWEGKQITYKCNKGYQLRGPLTRVCKETGNWTMEKPVCEGEWHLLLIIYRLLATNYFTNLFHHPIDSFLSIIDLL